MNAYKASDANYIPSPGYPGADTLEENVSLWCRAVLSWTSDRQILANHNQLKIASILSLFLCWENLVRQNIYGLTE